jgi:hypothetical protein
MRRGSKLHAALLVTLIVAARYLRRHSERQATAPDDRVAGDRQSLLLGIYGIERSADQSAGVIALALATVGITYVATTAAFFVQRCGTMGCAAAQLPNPVVLAAPLVPIALFAYLVINLVATMARALYLDQIEKELAGMEPQDDLPWAPTFHNLVRPIYTPDKGSWLSGVMAILALFPYFAAFLLVTGYTVWVLLFQAREGNWRWVSLSFYGLIIVLGVMLMLLSLQPRFMRKLANLRRRRLVLQP